MTSLVTACRFYCAREKLGLNFRVQGSRRRGSSGATCPPVMGAWASTGSTLVGAVTPVASTTTASCSTSTTRVTSERCAPLRPSACRRCIFPLLVIIIRVIFVVFPRPFSPARPSSPSPHTSIMMSCGIPPRACPTVRPACYFAVYGRNLAMSLFPEPPRTRPGARAALSGLQPSQCLSPSHTLPIASALRPPRRWA